MVSLEVVLHLSLLQAELFELARALPPRAARIVLHAACVLDGLHLAANEQDEAEHQDDAEQPDPESN